MFTMKGTIIFDLEGTLVDVGGESLSQVFITEDMLDDLAKEYNLAIVTGASRAQLEYVLRSTFLNRYFVEKNTVTKDEVPAKKETGEPFDVLIQMDLQKPMVVIGDSEGDQLGAKATNLPFVQVNTPALSTDVSVMREYLKTAIKLMHQIA